MPLLADAFGPIVDTGLPTILTWTLYTKFNLFRVLGSKEIEFGYRVDRQETQKDRLTYG